MKTRAERVAPASLDAGHAAARRAWLARALAFAAPALAASALLGPLQAQGTTALPPRSRPPSPPSPSTAPPPDHEPFGRVDPPQPAIALPLLRDDARLGSLSRLLDGRTTAVQLMFTGCSAICPIQGALFSEVARRLPNGDAQLLSLSIDPLADDPRALRRWLDRFDATPRWRAAAPRVTDVDALLEALRGRAAGFDRHSGQVFLFDRRARLVYRTPEMPPAAHVLTLLDSVSGRA